MEATALFNSGATLSCISKCFYDHIRHIKPSMVIDTNAGPAIVVNLASDDKLINLGQCRLRIKLGEKTFEYYFQILKNLKRDLILGLNFQRMFKISQDITDDNDLYLHIRRKIATFSQQAKNTTNHIKKKKNSQFIAINSIPFPQTVLTMYNKLTMVMLPAGVKNNQDYDSRDFLSWFKVGCTFGSL